MASSENETKTSAEPSAKQHPEIRSSVLETLPAPSRSEVVTIQTEEVSGLCPVEYEDGNEVRDFYRVTVMFTPSIDDPKTVELKSLKLYWEQFQNVAISHEQVASTVYDHLNIYLEPDALYVRCEPNIRGGTTTMIEIGEMPEGRQEIRRHKDL